MTDTSNADASPDAQPSPPPWRPPPPPTSLQGISNVWNRGRDQPTTVAGAPLQQPPQPPPPNPMSGTWQPGPKSPLSRLNQVPPGTRLPPPPPWQRYMKPLPIREHPDWGQPDRFAALPQQFELHGLYQNLGRYFGQFGAGSSPMLAGLISASSGAYQKGVMEGNEALMKLAGDRLALNSARLEENEQRSLTETADILAEYEAAANQTDPDKVGNYAIGGVDLRTALEQKAQELDNKPLMGLLASGAPMSKVVEFLKIQDANWRTLHAANKTANKEAQTAKDLTDWGVPGASTSDVQGSPGSPTTPPMPGSESGIQYGLPPTPDPNAPSPQAQPTAASQPETQGDRVAAMPDYQKSGIELLRGGKLEGVPKDVQPYVKKFADQTLGQIDDLVAKARGGKMSKDQIDQELRKINPAIAGEFAGIRDLDNPLPGGMGAINASPFWRDMAALAEASVPGWRVNDYTVIGEMQRDYTTGTSSRRMQAANNMADAAVPLLKALRDIPEGEPVPVNWASQIAAKKFTGDPKWVRLYNAVQQYVQESQSLASPTGRYFEGDVNRLMQEFDTAMGPRALRAIIATDADAASRRIQTLTDDYENTTRKPYPPHYNPKSTAIISALAKLNPDKGFADVPDLPPDLQGLGMGASGGGGWKAPPGVTIEPVQ